MLMDGEKDEQMDEWICIPTDTLQKWFWGQIVVHPLRQNEMFQDFVFLFHFHLYGHFHNFYFK